MRKQQVPEKVIGETLAKKTHLVNGLQYQNPANSEALVGVSGTTPAKELLGSLEPRNNFRTSANPRRTSRFRETGDKSASLLRDMDSNHDYQVQSLASYR